jgi:NTP pyrophosphatase (non-canonical NTP hydrolase)
MTKPHDLDELAARGQFAFGDDTLPGLAKLVEECGEVVQVVGKLMMTHGSPAHWSGNLRAQLIDELGDLDAAIEFVVMHCFDVDERAAIASRRVSKIVKFEDWHEDFGADPPPPLASLTRSLGGG